jgi:sugar phosphate isomerase/epimerase
MPDSAEQTLGYLIESGLSSVELMDGPINRFIKRPGIDGNAPDASDKWLAASEDKEVLARCAALRKMYADAGVTIHTAKFGNIGDGKMTDGEIVWCLCMAKALGAVAITREVDENAAKRLGPIADKHKVYIGMHNHEQINAKTYDGPILGCGEYIAINLDIGHYTAANDDSVVELVEKFSKRISSLHLKDRKNKANGRANMPFGEGNTPIVEVLNLMKKNKYTFPADIELEYPVPADSNPVKEVAKCVQYCKKAVS